MTSYIAVLGVGAGLLAGMLLMASAKHGASANRVLGVFILSLAAMQAQRFVSHSGYLLDMVHLQGATQSLRFLLGPSLYLYIRLLAGNEFSLGRENLWHLVPAVVSLLVFLPVYLQPEEVKLAFIATYITDGPADILRSIREANLPGVLMIFRINLLLIAAVLLHWIAYSVVSLVALRRHTRELRSHFSSLDRITLRWLYGFVLLVLFVGLISLVFLARYPTNPPLGFRGLEFIPTLLLTCMMFYVGFMGLRQPSIYRREAFQAGYGADPAGPDEAQKSSKYDRSGLSDQERKAIWHSLQALMESEKPYRIPGLTLPVLAETLNVRVAHLSQTINVEAKMNFFDFINRFRIEEAQAMLRERGEAVPLSTMGYDVGFNSKSTFYTQFKRHSGGLTPRKYLESVQN